MTYSSAASHRGDCSESKNVRIFYSIIGLVFGDCQQIPTVVGMDFYFFSEMHIRLLDLCRAESSGDIKALNGLSNVT